MKNKLSKLLSMALGIAICLILLPTTNALADEVEPSWTTKASMSEARASFQSVIINEKIYVISGGNSTGSIASTEVYDPSTNQWSTLAPMLTSRFAFQAQVIDGKIYAIGGTHGSGFTSSGLTSVEVYDPATNKWSTTASMPSPHSNFQTEVIDGKIYAIGGIYSKNASDISSSVEVYDPATNIWTSLAPMPTARAQFQTEVIDGKIYAIGGRNKPENALSTIEVYDPATNIWTSLTSMPTARTQFQTEVIDGNIYAIGGYDKTLNGTSSTEKYNPATNEWTTLPLMATGRVAFQAEVIDRNIYAIGGLDASTEKYNPTTNEWTTLPSMATGRVGFQTAVINNTIYAIGGQNGSDIFSSVEAYAPTSSAPTVTTPTLTASAGDNQVNLSWTTTGNAASYDVYRSTTSGGPYTKIASGITGAAYTDTGVTNRTTYYYVVTAVNASGTEGAYSNEASATPTAATTTGSNATLRITMVTGEIKEYQVTSAKATEFVNWFYGRAANYPTFIFEKPSSELGPYKSGKEYLAYDKISSFEILDY